MDWTRILELILSFAAGGGLITLVTLKEKKKKAQADNRDQAIQALEECIKSLTEQINYRDDKLAKKEDENDNLRTILASERSEKASLQAKATTMGMCMCVHLGCQGRKPSQGRGLSYYEEHRNEDGFGSDYLTIHQIMDTLKEENK